MEWQPIETAPKTSRAILVWTPENKCTFCVSWNDDESFKGWTIFGGSWRDCIQRPSHWMPLPEPPEADDE